MNIDFNHFLKLRLFPLDEIKLLPHSFSQGCGEACMRMPVLTLIQTLSPVLPQHYAPFTRDVEWVRKCSQFFTRFVTPVSLSGRWGGRHDFILEKPVLFQLLVSSVLSLFNNNILSIVNLSLSEFSAYASSDKVYK